MYGPSFTYVHSILILEYSIIYTLFMGGQTVVSQVMLLCKLYWLLTTELANKVFKGKWTTQYLLS